MSSSDRRLGGRDRTDSSQAHSPHHRWQGLDGLRAVAVIAVVTYHFDPTALPGGLLGVDIFFVISGYLITRLITTEFFSRGRIGAGAFYRRRARRLFPALTVVLVAVSVSALIWRDQLATVRPGVVFSALFSANWWLAFEHQSYFVATGRPSMLSHLWSLGVEEQFYLCWPLITALTLTLAVRNSPDTLTDREYLRKGVLPLATVAVALSLLSTALMWWLADAKDVPYTDPSTVYYSTETHCMGLLLGAALGAWAVAAEPPAWWSRRLDLGVELLGISAFIGVLVCTKDFAGYSYHLYRGGFLLVSALVCVVIVAATRPESRLGQTLDWAPLKWIGVRSYSIYLWHWPVAVVTRPGLDTSMPTWLDQLLRVALTVGLSDLTYRYVETPMRRDGIGTTLAAWSATIRAQLRQRRATVATVSAGAFSALAIVGLGVLVIGPSAPIPASAASGPGGAHLVVTPNPSEPPVGPRRHGATPSTQLPKISGYGDSVLLDARHALGTLFAGGTIDAIIGRQPGPILADIRAAARARALNPVVIIHIGNNGLIRAADLERTLRMLENPRSGARVVLVVNDHIDPYDNSWQKPNNKTIARVVPRYSDAHVVAWDKIAGEHHDWLYADDVHLRPQGVIGYAQMLATAYRNATKAKR